MASDLVMGSNVTIVTFSPSTAVVDPGSNLCYMAKHSPAPGFGERLYIARTPPHANREIKIAEIAAKLKLSRQAVMKWEINAQPAIKPANLYALADFLRVRPRWLACNEGPKDIDLPDQATRLAEDWATLPDEYRAAVRKHVNDLLAVLHTLPALRNHISDDRVSQFLKPAPPAEENLTSRYHDNEGQAPPAELKAGVGREITPKRRSKS